MDSGEDETKKSFGERVRGRAVSVGNPREFLQAEKEDQKMAEACKRLIKMHSKRPSFKP